VFTLSGLCFYGKLIVIRVIHVALLSRSTVSYLCIVNVILRGQINYDDESYIQNINVKFYLLIAVAG